MGMRCDRSRGLLCGSHTGRFMESNSMGHRRTGQGQCHAANTCTGIKELYSLAGLSESCEDSVQAAQLQAGSTIWQAAAPDIFASQGS